MLDLAKLLPPGILAPKDQLRSSDNPAKAFKRRDLPPLDAGVTSSKLTEGSATVETEGDQAQVAAQASSTKNDTPSDQKVKAAK